MTPARRFAQMPNGGGGGGPGMQLLLCPPSPETDEWTPYNTRKVSWDFPGWTSQWLRLHVSHVEGSIPGWETKTQQALGHDQKKKKGAL